MSRTHRRSIDRNRPVHSLETVDLDDDALFDLPDDDEPVAVDRHFEDEGRDLLERVLGDNRRRLMATARHHLRHDDLEADDVVQDVCADALDGQLSLPGDAAGMLDELRREVARRCRSGGR